FLEEPKVVAAMSAVREVDLEPQPSDPQGAIDRAIATLDREARGETDSGIDVADGYDDEDERPNGKARGFGAMLPKPRKPAARARNERPPARGARREPLSPPLRRREAAFPEAGFPRAR